MGETNPPTAADWAGAAAHDAKVKAEAGTGALDLLCQLLEAKGVLTQREYEAVKYRATWR